jgi:hypothetical protein
VLITPAGELAALVPQRHQPPQVHQDVVGLALVRVLYLAGMEDTHQASTKPQLRAASYARLSETYDAAESVPTQLANADKYAEWLGWRVVARFKDDGYSAFKEIRRDDFVNLIEAIDGDEIDVVIIRDVDRLTRNLPDWSRFEKAAVEHRVVLSAYTGGDLDLSTPEGAYYGAWRRCGPSGKAPSRATLNKWAELHPVHHSAGRVNTRCLRRSVRPCGAVSLPGRRAAAVTWDFKDRQYPMPR